MNKPDDDMAWISNLAEASAYPHDAGAAQGIRRIDTHISHVFLTPSRAYKVRRPVRLAFLDFSDGRERLSDCLREVALNRRLAPDVYLGLAPILRTGKDSSRVWVGELAEEPDPAALEHCVVMRRLEEGRDLRSLLAAGRIQAGHLDRVAARLARFHRAHRLDVLDDLYPGAAADWVERTTAPARANFEALAAMPADLVPPDQVKEAGRLASALAESRREDFERRRRDGRIVDGHGDLHAEHVWFETDDAEPLMIDCLEFRDDFRHIDAASDVAFLAMDLCYRGHRDLAARFLRRYARDSGDYHLFTVVDYFLAYRAMVRAKVASLVATDSSMAAEQREHARDSVRDHLALGLSFLRDRGPGRLVIACGSIGTGKTTVAEALADELGGVVLSSDRLRGETDMRRQDHRSSMGDSSDVASDASTADTAADSTAEAPYGHSRYSEASRDAVYRRMFDEAVFVLRSGRVAVLDATFSRREWRRAALELARAQGCPATLVETVAPREEVIERLAERAAAGNDASEAGPGLYDAMRAEFEDSSEWPEEDRVRIDTSEPDWREQVAAVAARLRDGNEPFTAA